MEDGNPPSDTKAELATVEKRLEVLSRTESATANPSRSPRHLRVEKVAPGVWRDSQECQCIRGSKYFQSACAKVLGLRRELAGRKLRQELASTPLVATSDPLPKHSLSRSAGFKTSFDDDARALRPEGEQVTLTAQSRGSPMQLTSRHQ